MTQHREREWQASSAVRRVIMNDALNLIWVDMADARDELITVPRNASETVAACIHEEGEVGAVSYDPSTIGVCCLPDEWNVHVRM
eukprot:c14263_g1_i2 orf=404-658(+)